MAAETTEFAFRTFSQLWNRKPTLTALPGPGETSAPTTATLTIVCTLGATPADTTFTFNQATT